jgi:hypothetical protein
MSHVTDRLAEFIFEELPAAEMAEANRHVNECANCREQVNRFRQTLAMLQVSPEVEPPRNIVFEFEKPATSRFWKWLPAATAIAALLLVTVALAGGLHVEWGDSRVTLAFGEVRSSLPAEPSADLAAEIQRLKGHVAFLEGRQQAVERDTYVIATKLEPITRAQSSPAGD